jgi:hypothetical protein
MVWFPDLANPDYELLQTHERLTSSRRVALEEEVKCYELFNWKSNIYTAHELYKVYMDNTLNKNKKNSNI